MDLQRSESENPPFFIINNEILYEIFTHIVNVIDMRNVQLV